MIFTKDEGYNLLTVSLLSELRSMREELSSLLIDVSDGELIRVKVTGVDDAEANYDPFHECIVHDDFALFIEGFDKDKCIYKILRF